MFTTLENEVNLYFYLFWDVSSSRSLESIKSLESLEDLDRNLKARGSQLYLFEGNSTDVIQELTRQLLKLGDRPKLFVNHDLQVQYGIERGRQIIDFYRQHSLEYHQGVNNFLQTDSDRRDEWMEEYYNYLWQPLHPTPERINTPQLQLDIPQLAFSQLKQKYSQIWETENTYFSGGETQAIATR